MHRRSLITAATALPFAATAQERFPSRPMRMIIPVGVGGVTDVVGRILAEGMQPLLGQQPPGDARGLSQLPA